MADSVKEAQLILSIADQKLRPVRYKPRRAAAAKKLVDEFVNVVRGLGDISVSFTQDDKGYPLIAFGETIVKLMQDNSGVVMVARQSTYGQFNPAAEARLQYDPIDDALVGADIDAEVVPAPGERRPRVPALVVLAKLVTQLLEPEPKDVT